MDSPVPLVNEMARHILLADGKRLRPLLFVLSCRLCDGRLTDLYRLSSIFEYIHVASLLHDDVLDNAELRRKRPSANQVWGNHAAILQGDFLYAKALSIAIGTANVPFIGMLTESTRRMTEGQVMELGQARQWDLGKEAYLEIITAKTAVLISAACACGAIISGAGPEAVEALSHFGLEAGIAFQMIDDLLDYSSSEGIFGKPVGKDLREGKVTLPLIYTLSLLDPQEKKELTHHLSGERLPEHVCQAVVDRVRENGALGRIRQEAQGYVDRAVDCLKVFPDSEARRDLIHLGRRMIHRET